MNDNVNHNTKSPVYCVDLAKNKFEVHAFTPHGERRWARTMSRSQFARKFSSPNTERGRVVMEACASSHYWGRHLRGLGYRPKLVPAQFVAQHRMGNKTDGNDADAIYAVHHDRRVREVPIKTLEQQDQLAWHRVRERWVSQKTACINQMRGLLAERGVVAPRGRGGLHALMKQVYNEDLPQVTPTLQQIVAELHEELVQLEGKLERLDQQLKAHCQSNPVAQLLIGAHGIGPVTATALAGTFGNSVDNYRDCRQFAANLGLTPSEHSSGQTRKLGRITKRGNTYLRTLLTQCAQSIVISRAKREDALCQLARRLLDEKGKHRNLVILAVANHLARSIYAMLKHGEAYRPEGKSRTTAA